MKRSWSVVAIVLAFASAVSVGSSRSRLKADDCTPRLGISGSSRAGDPMTFTADDTNLDPADPGIFNWSDGQNLPGRVATRSFSSAGFYWVNLSAYTVCGDYRTSDFYNFEIRDSRCDRPGYTYQGIGNYRVSFSADPTRIQPGSANWDFGDGGHDCCGHNDVTHTYPGNGYYCVVVGGTDGCGVSSSSPAMCFSFGSSDDHPQPDNGGN